MNAVKAERVLLRRGGPPWTIGHDENAASPWRPPHLLARMFKSSSTYYGQRARRGEMRIIAGPTSMFEHDGNDIPTRVRPNFETARVRVPQIVKSLGRNRIRNFNDVRGTCRSDTGFRQSFSPRRNRARTAVCFRTFPPLTRSARDTIGAPITSTVVPHSRS